MTNGTTREIDGITMTDYTSDCKLLNAFGKIVQESRARRRAWLEELSCEGVVIQHPNDGWVNREKNQVSFAYPAIINAPAIKIGCKAALGEPDDYKIVRLTERHEYLLKIGSMKSWNNCLWSFEIISRTIDRRKL